MKEGSGLIGKIISYGLGIYIIAYVALDAVLAQANKSGFQNNATLGSTVLYNLSSTVLPVLLLIGVVWLLYKKSGLDKGR